MADAIRVVTTEQILADATMVATFVRALIAEHMPLSVASSLASTYLSSTILARAQHEKPKEPWEDEKP